jgi:regulator of protease activity HflC (stomatin/prohibitin superfamily)
MGKLLIGAVVLGFIGVFVFLVGLTTVPAGYVGVKVYLLGTDKGVDTEELGVGRYWLTWNEQMYLFPTFMQNYVWTADNRPGSETDESFSFQTRDGMKVSADVGISYQIDPNKVTNIYQTYRRGVDEITDTFLRNMVSDALVKVSSSKPVEYVYGEGKAELMDEVTRLVTAQVEPIGINVTKIYWIGDVRVPEEVTKSINSKLAATQMAQQRQNEVAQSKAEAQKRIEAARGEAESTLIQARAQAESNRLISESITPTLVQYKSIEKWDGVMPRITGGQQPTGIVDFGSVSGVGATK